MRRRKFLELVACGSAGLLSTVSGCTGIIDTGNSLPESEGPAKIGSASGGYPTYRYDSGNSGYAEVSGPSKNVDKAWYYTDGDSKPYSSLTPTIDDGTVYFTEIYNPSPKDGKPTKIVVTALNSVDGSDIWRHEVEGEDVSNSAEEATVVDGKLIQAMGESLKALDTSNGDVVWENPDIDVQSGVSVSDGKGYGVGFERGLHAFSIEDGEELWEYEGLERDSTPVRTPTPAVSDSENTVYLGGKKLVGIDTENGKEKWTRKLEKGKRVTTSPVAVESDEGVNIYAGCEGSVFRGFSGDDGSDLWEVKLKKNDNQKNPMKYPPAVHESGDLFGSALGTLVSIDETGEVNWENRVEGFSGPVVADDERVYLSGFNSVTAFDAEDGEKVWKYSTNEEFGSQGTAPVVGGGVYLPSRGLHAIGEK